MQHMGGRFFRHRRVVKGTDAYATDTVTAAKNVA